ncbi:DNA-binding response regulator [Actinocatenispora thailandica]|uniref:DNA-binding response regulator n=1 Tax=Actinocatenispora thailandica TaxID=227318 RepID=A0A7R7HVV0_9ACTN|nr:response regulator transcription factor [Actinocatenispora thailandica]BCJ34203.1 DNA-binding response regulator [Actinocatenispora thailandica]
MVIGVADDEPAVRDALVRALRFEGYEVCTAADGAAALRLFVEHDVELLVLDVRMPGMDGLDACRALRAAGNPVPVLMLTAADAVQDRVAGLDAGADDYLAKPFALPELLARIRALLRRAAPAAPEVLGYDDLRLDTATREVRRGDRLLRLTRTEFSILEMFLRHPRQVLYRSTVVQAIWGGDVSPTSNSLDVYVGYLRRKLEAGGEPRLLHTARGIGYVLRATPL